VVLENKKFEHRTENNEHRQIFPFLFKYIEESVSGKQEQVQVGGSIINH